MNRRGFLRSLVGGVAAAAVVRTFPFRVYSFPTEVVLPDWELLCAATLKDLRADVLYDNFFIDSLWLRRLSLTEASLMPSELRSPFIYKAT